MPDFLLCNSKLTFQLTMTPEKTNFITQGGDGIKRLKQGPDISSYRGLSVIHSRAFSLEAGQQPRDILRRRVRTAEYYRILPHKDNVNREFEFYTEERDGWFTVTFQDLLRHAAYPGSHVGMSAQMMGRDRSVYGRDNHARLERVFQEMRASPQAGGGARDQGPAGGLMLGAGVRGMGIQAAAMVQLEDEEQSFVDAQKVFVRKVVVGKDVYPLLALFGDAGSNRNVYTSNKSGVQYEWGVRPKCFDMGVQHIPPSPDRFPLWAAWEEGLRSGGIPEPVASSMTCTPRLAPVMQESLFSRMRHIQLNHPFKAYTVVHPGSPEWYQAFMYYQEVYRRHGVCMDQLDLGPENAMIEKLRAASATRLSTNDVVNHRLRSVVVMSQLKAKSKNERTGPSYIGDQVLSQRGLNGCVNHECQFLPDQCFWRLASRMTKKSTAAYAARSLILTYEVVEPLLCEYIKDGITMTGLEYIERYVSCRDTALDSTGAPILNAGAPMTRADQLYAVIRLCSVQGGHILDYTLAATSAIAVILTAIFENVPKKTASEQGGAYLAKAGVNLWPMGVTSRSHLLHHDSKYGIQVLTEDMAHISQTSYGFLNLACLASMRDFNHTTFTLLPTHHFFRPVLRAFTGLVMDEYDADHCVQEWKFFWSTIRSRIYDDPVCGESGVDCDDDQFTDNRQWRPFELIHDDGIEDLLTMQTGGVSLSPSNGWASEVTSSNELESVGVDLNSLFKKLRAPRRVIPADPVAELLADQVEIVIVRPNIEHNMLGVIMGLAGSELGHTLWGQTELACYDDSMHGIWGMSYKYHQRAIVFNERNLVRLWDIAYDGYNGGKDDTCVDWLHQDDPKTGLNVFRDATLDLSRSYRGPSMMVMAFVHDKNEVDEAGRSVFDKNFRRNWPSPIVFHDMHNPSRVAAPANETLPLDHENLQVTDVEDFRVFNNALYSHSYGAYRNMMPAFHELHKMRKSAGQASADSETHTDSLAFQGSMRIKSRGSIMQDIQGSGHHGPDYVGVASVRAGKGIKYNGMAPALTHMV